TFLFFKQKAAYEMPKCLEFRRVLFRSLADPRRVPDAVAAALDVRALPGQELVDAVVDYLAPRSLLLVADNCEHVLAATAGFADRSEERRVGKEGRSVREAAAGDGASM